MEFEEVEVEDWRGVEGCLRWQGGGTERGLGRNDFFFLVFS